MSHPIDWTARWNAANAEAQRLEAEAKALRHAARTIARILRKQTPSIAEDATAWDLAENVLLRHGIQTPNSGLLCWIA